MPIVRSTKGQAGSFKNFISSVYESAKQTLAPKSTKTQISYTESGQAVISPADEPRPSGTTYTYVSGGGGGSGVTAAGRPIYSGGTSTITQSDLKGSIPSGMTAAGKPIYSQQQRQQELQRQAATQQQRQQELQRQAAAGQQFSGKVAEISPETGKPIETKYFVRGEQTGRIYTTPKGERYAETTKPSRFVFEREDGTREVEFRRGETPAEIVDTMWQGVPSLETEDVGEVLTEEQTRQMELEKIYARMEQPFGTRIRMAYQGVSTPEELIKMPIIREYTPKGELPYGLEPGSKGGIRGGIRVGFALTGIGLEKIGITPQKIEKIPVGKFLTKPVKTKTAEDIALTIGILGPISPTTAQIERQLFQASRVKLIGVTQKTRAGSIKTEAVFGVERGGRVVKGVAKGGKQIKGAVKSISKVVQRTPKGDAVVTATRGVRISRGIEFPTGREIIRVSKPFKAGQVSQVIKRGGLFFTRGIGAVKKTPKGSIERFVSFGVGQTGKSGKWIAQVGRTSARLDETVSVGLFKIRGVETDIVKVTGSGGTYATISQAAKSAALQATKSAVSSAVKISPSQPLNLLSSLPLVSAQTPSVKITSIQALDIPAQVMTVPEVSKPAPQLPRITTIQKESQKDIQKARTSGRLIQPSKEISRQLQPPIQLQPPAQLQQPRQISQQIYKQQQRYLTTQKTISISKLSPRFNIPISPQPKFPIPKGLIFKFPKKKFKVAKGEKTFPAYLRRFGKFKIAGYGRSPLEAVGIGKRAVQKTLAATFKVPSFKGLEVSGFRTKKTKEGVLFIEPRGKRLKKGTFEIPEIQFYRKLKGGKK